MLEISAILIPADDEEEEEEESVRGQGDNGAMTRRPFYQCIRVMKSQRKKDKPIYVRFVPFSKESKVEQGRCLLNVIMSHLRNLRIQISTAAYKYTNSITRTCTTNPQKKAY